MNWKIDTNDVLKWAASYKGAKFHALLCDPPYHLTSITKRFGKSGSAPAQYGRDGAFARASAGFMGQAWDGGDVAFRPETWAALGEHLYPGAFGMAFASARGWHRLAVAIEDAGFVIHPSIFLWAYGSGFPKATRIDTQIDRDAKADRELIANPIAKKQTGQANTAAFAGDRQNNAHLSLPATPLAQTWEGHRYGLQALKPAAEPIIVFQKPYQGRPLDCITGTGAGALNIAASRIPSPGEIVKINRWEDGSKPFGGGAGHPFEGVDSKDGRWAANLIIDEGAAKRLDAQSGFTATKRNEKPSDCGGNTWGGTFQTQRGARGHTDAGGASRYFYNVKNQIDEADPLYYCSKASPSERDAGLESLPESRNILTTSKGLGNALARCPQHDATLPSGSSKYNCGCYMVFNDEQEERRTGRKNSHPTVKPIQLNMYLATLLLPPAEYAPRRILVPFSGSGSEMIGALTAGWDEAQGIEMTPEYVALAEKRLEYWLKKAPGAGQMRLF